MVDPGQDVGAAIDAALGVGSGGSSTPPASPPVGAPAATPPAASSPTPPEPEFEIEPGQKVKKADIIAWRQAHQDSENLKPVRELDEFLSHPENKRFSQAILAILNNTDDARLQSVLDLLEGKPAATPAPAGTPPTQPSATPSLADLEKAAGDDPQIKALVGYLKALETKLGGLEQFKTQRETADQKTQREEAARQAQARAQTQLEDAWKSQKFPDILARYPEAHRKEVETELRNRMLFAFLAAEGKVPMADIAKQVHGRTTLLVDALIDAYVKSKAGAPPAGGASATGAGAPAKVPETREEQEKAIDEMLNGAEAVR